MLTTRMDSQISKKTIVFNKFRKLLKNKICEFLLFPFTNKKPLSNFFVKITPVNELYEPNSIRKVKRNGINFELDISDYQNWLIYFGINNDASEGLFSLLKPGFTVIDIGSNIGQTALICAKSIGKTGKIIGFEPDTINFEKAQRNIKLNSFSNITIHNLALGQRKEEVPLKINSPQNRGGNRIDRTLTDSKNIIQVDTLDNIVSKLNISAVDLIKIDVEGFELEVLNGAKETIDKFKPLMFIEMNDKNLKEQNVSAKELLSSLLHNNYSVKEAVSGKNITVETILLNCSFDIIAEPQKI